MTLLNTATKIYLGSNLVGKVYAGNTEIWTPPAVPQFTVRQIATNKATNISSISVSLTDVLAGSAIIVCANPVRDGTLAPSVSILGTTFSGNLRADTIASVNGYGGKAQIIYGFNMTAGNKTITVRFTSGDRYYHACAFEVVGGLTALDTYISSGAGTGTALSSGTTAATSAAQAFAVCDFLQQSNASNNTFTVPDGYTNIYTETDSSSYAAGIAAYKSLTEIGPQSASSTTNQNNQWNGVLAVFK